jgi:hypothetical protein
VLANYRETPGVSHGTDLRTARIDSSGLKTPAATTAVPFFTLSEAAL